MKKQRDSKTGRFIPTDYSKYIGKIFGCCKLLKVFSYKTTKRADVQCIHCGKVKTIGASYLFTQVNRYCSCECLDNQRQAIDELSNKYLNDEKLISSNKTGVMEIAHCKARRTRKKDYYTVSIQKDNKRYYVGEFTDLGDAIEARYKFIQKMGWNK